MSFPPVSDTNVNRSTVLVNLYEWRVAVQLLKMRDGLKSLSR